MLQSLKAVYDGTTLRFAENIAVQTPQDVIVVFLNPINQPTDDLLINDMLQIAANNPALAFLNNAEEDIYTDNDLKKRYK
jgi:hypothetical protein